MFGLKIKPSFIILFLPLSFLLAFNNDVGEGEIEGFVYEIRSEPNSSKLGCSGVKVIVAEEKNVIKKTITDDSGKFIIIGLPENRPLTLQYRAVGYQPKELEIKVKIENDKLILDDHYIWSNDLKEEELIATVKSFLEKQKNLSDALAAVKPLNLNSAFIEIIANTAKNGEYKNLIMATLITDESDQKNVPYDYAQKRKYPNRDITAVVVWAAGGGTDTTNRVVLSEMSKYLGVNINVINKTGGVAGSVGLNYVYSRPHDGYTLCGLSESTVTAGVQGGWDKRFDVWDTFIVGGSPDVISVTYDAPYKTLKDLIEASKAKPKSIKAAASGAGSIHHLNLLAVEGGSGAKFNFIPYKGSVPSQNAAMVGEVSVVVTSLIDQQKLLREGKLRALGMLIPDSFNIEGIGMIPSSFDAYPMLAKYLPIPNSIGFAVPVEAPTEVKVVLADAFSKAINSEKVTNWAKANYFRLSGKTGAEANAVFSELESNFAWTLWEMKAARVDPASLGIPRP